MTAPSKTESAWATRQSGRLLRIARGVGRLLVATDLQGNLDDFHRMAEHFRKVVAVWPGSQLVFTGDLVHGPELPMSNWPDYLGSFYTDDSPGVLRAFAALSAEFPGRVHALLGNHEHAHVGGPTVGKFFLDEAAHLDEKLGSEGAGWMKQLISHWPLVAVAANGVVLTHAAPAAHMAVPGISTGRPPIRRRRATRARCYRTCTRAAGSARCCGRGRRIPRWRADS